MTLLNSLRRFLRRDESASVSVEAVMIFPLLLWAYFGMFILFDAYRALSSTIRASYTIADMLSREDEVTVTPDYIDGLQDILDVLAQSPHRTVLRVTQVQYDAANDKHLLDFSYITEADGLSAVNEGTLQQEISDHLPPMANGSHLVVVEVWSAFVPFMNINLKPFYFETRTVTRPRSGVPIAWDDPTTTS